MQRFGRVLMHLASGDGDRPSLQAVEDLVRRNGASLTLMSVVDEDAARTDAATHLAKTADTLDVPCAIEIDRGVAAIAVVRRVLRGEADLVVAVDDESPPSPNTRRLLRECPCPVWVIRPHAVAAASNGLNVVAAVDPTPADTDLNLLILELASSMVERAGGILHVVHAWEMVGSATRPGRSRLSRFDVTYDELIIQARGSRADALDALLSRLRPYEIERQVHIVHGPPESEIPRLLDDVRPDVLVMGTVARTGIRGLLFGNTAERVLTSAPCSLMAVKPADFVSPISESD